MKLNLFPVAALAGPEDRVDDLLVRHRTFQRENLFAAALRGAGEGLGLQPVLLHAGEAENGGLGVALVVQLDLVVLVEARIERRAALR